MNTYNLMEECLNRELIPTDEYSEKNRELVKKLQRGGEEAFAELALINGRLVVNVMKQYVPSYIYQDYKDDLFQQGLLGVRRAASTYDCEAETVFSTYAYPWIKQYILRYIACNRLIHIPYEVINKSVKVDKFIEQYKFEHMGKMPDDDTICEGTNISPQALRDIYLSVGDVLSLDSVVCSLDDENREILLIDTLADPNAEIEKNIICNELRSLLVSLIKQETRGKQRDYNIVVKHFGLDGEEPTTMRELSKMYELSYERVRQIIENTVSKLGKPQNTSQLKEYMDI